MHPRPGTCSSSTSVDKIFVGDSTLTIASWFFDGGAEITHEDLALRWDAGEVLTLSREFNTSPGVEVAGIEPASDGVMAGLLRAQCAMEFLGPRARTHAFPDRPSRVDVPRRPPT